MRQPSRGAFAIRAARAALAAGIAITPAAAQQAPPVALAEARETELVEELTLTGTLTAPRRAGLAPEVDGRIESIAVDAGDRVESGEALVELNDTLAELELRQARASRREAEADLADAERRLREARSLIDQESIPETEVRAREAEVERATAVLERLRAEAAYQQELVQRHTLTAPFTGVIAQRTADVGERVGPDTPILELVAVERLRLDLQVPQSYYGRVGPDTTVQVRLDARPDARIEARVDEVVPVSDADTRTFLSRVRLDNRDGRMTPGMSARAALQLGTGERGVVIPRDALIRYPDGRTVVWLAEGEGVTRTVRERRVRTGLEFEGRVAIREGLSAGAAVVIRGNEGLAEGQTVRVTDSE